MSVEATTQNDDVLQGLLTAARRRPAREDSAPEVAEYDWNCPYYFTGEEMALLNRFGEGAGKELSAAMTGLFRSRFELFLAGVSQHYGRAVVEADGGGELYFIPLRNQSAEECGYLAVRTADARGWISTLLGGGEEAQDERELSRLETDLLLELGKALAEAISAAGKASSSVAFTCAERLSKETPIAEAGLAEAYCRFAFCAEEGSKDASIRVVLSCKIIESLAKTGQAGQAEQAEGAKKDNRQAMTQHLQRAAVRLRVTLGFAWVRMSHMVNIESGDVLLLESSSGRLTDVVIGNKTVFRALAVRSEGQYAVQIVADPSA